MRDFGFSLNKAIFLLALLVIVNGQTVSAAPSETSKPRLALIIGNGSYPTAPLDNPPNDAASLTASLEPLGFDVLAFSNLGRTAMLQAIDEFANKLKQAGPEASSLFFFAGHGVQIQSQNILLPTDVSLNTPSDLLTDGIPIAYLMRRLEEVGNRLNIVILDACRNNPFPPDEQPGGEGLSDMEAPRNTFIAYATAPGLVALDGQETNSPYSWSLVKHLPTPGLTIEQIFKRVRADVLKMTDNFQMPWERSSLTDEFYFIPASAVLKKQEVQPKKDWAKELAAWNKVRADMAKTFQEKYAPILEKNGMGQRLAPYLEKLEDDLWNQFGNSLQPELVASYLAAFPEGKYVDKARARLQELQQTAKTVKMTQLSQNLKVDFSSFFEKNSGAKAIKAQAEKLADEVVENIPEIEEAIPDEAWRIEVIHNLQACMANKGRFSDEHLLNPSLTSERVVSKFRASWQSFNVDVRYSRPNIKDDDWDIFIVYRMGREIKTASGRIVDPSANSQFELQSDGCVSSRITLKEKIKL